MKIFWYFVLIGMTQLVEIAHFPRFRFSLLLNLSIVQFFILRKVAVSNGEQNFSSNDTLHRPKPNTPSSSVG